MCFSVNTSQCLGVNVLTHNDLSCKVWAVGPKGISLTPRYKDEVQGNLIVIINSRLLVVVVCAWKFTSEVAKSYTQSCYDCLLTDVSPWARPKFLHASIQQDIHIHLSQAADIEQHVSVSASQTSLPASSSYCILADVCTGKARDLRSQLPDLHGDSPCYWTGSQSTQLSFPHYLCMAFHYLHLSAHFLGTE